MQFETITLYTSQPRSPHAASFADYMRVLSGKPVQVLPVEQLHRIPPDQRRRGQLQDELRQLKGQLEAVGYFIAKGEQDPFRYQDSLAELRHARTRYLTQIAQTERALGIEPKGGVEL
ncbi:hypothetical protein LJY25_08305 [Hymenobacter sp. BT175]|uniref:hypothetical protein n=1 Tax=Hymenobacter translucens TaxID=2886507 RepID=UPI001D0E49D5|nr:hypothetical protein [Hymenobacter translucens]MCC2546443.1 hypothetical protein [Hymenobacter translucens]